MKALIGTDEMAKDVAGAEMLIERHQEHKVIGFSSLKNASFCSAEVISLIHVSQIGLY